ncbi:hypothetical protein M427DRAFT_488652 [Gonapodya prolifera JEL478]|uniref:Uncharacterized protein n=1 Tax=Gonapodya prolifera (strain JEL478) TaxID=1344416 RepID=A0A138ZZF9_GONPJ|nr:hypothetical protein M427DRAFT_488652 [Gonapodya prolifera JEL478]|eukprot:KXS09896.1 hypothetical protein M427DRAFT_488652 [Gonapodya prolifera JEL478]
MSYSVLFHLTQIELRRQGDRVGTLGHHADVITPTLARQTCGLLATTPLGAALADRIGQDVETLKEMVDRAILNPPLASLEHEVLGCVIFLLRTSIREASVRMQVQNLNRIAINGGFPPKILERATTHKTTPAHTERCPSWSFLKIAIRGITSGSKRSTIFGVPKPRRLVCGYRKCLSTAKIPVTAKHYVAVRAADWCGTAIWIVRDATWWITRSSAPRNCRSDL